MIWVTACTSLLLMPPATLGRRIRLFDGKAGCRSCRNLYSVEKKLLVMSNERSGLCLSCHRI